MNLPSGDQSVRISKKFPTIRPVIYENELVSGPTEMKHSETLIDISGHTGQNRFLHLHLISDLERFFRFVKLMMFSLNVISARSGVCGVGVDQQS